MAAESSGLTASLALVSFALVAAVHAGFVVWLFRARLLSRPLSRPAQRFVLALLATVAWALMGLLDLQSTKMLTWHLTWLLDQLRYAAWAAFGLALLQPAGAHTRPWAWRGAGLPAAAFAAGLAANLYLGFVDEGSALALRLLLASQLAWAVLGIVLVEQLFRNQTESSRWAAKPLCLGLGCIFVYDVYLFAQALMFGSFDADALSARLSLIHI